jgi:hypothetical protein
MPSWLPGVLVVLILFPLGLWVLTYAVVRGLSWLRYLGHWCCVLAFLPLAANAGNGIFRDGFDPPGSCPQGRITHTVVSWRYDGIGRRGTDVMHAENIWGRSTATGPSVGYPWLNFFAVFWALPRHGYVAAVFDIPSDIPPGQWGMFTHGETIPGPATDMAISDWCGDFNPPEPDCVRRNTGTGHRMGTHAVRPGGPIVACPLEASGSYYVNIRFTDPNAQDFYCGPQTCQTTVQHNRNNP